MGLSREKLQRQNVKVNTDQPNRLRHKANNKDSDTNYPWRNYFRLLHTAGRTGVILLNQRVDATLP